ncbi:MAG TPA: hypothetical protein VES00_00085, partial [Burkholderiaceae bacterium]|nr:hypothetical protein [Burkholderiaceae bacterium]
MIVQALRWVREHKSSAAGLALVVLGCYALLSLWRRVEHLGGKPAAAVAAAPASAARGRAPDASQAARGPAERAASTAAMRAEFEAAARYADFIAQAMRRPEQGGEFYALLAWKRCDAVGSHGGGAAPGAGNEAFRADALALVQDLAKRCVGVQVTWPTIDALGQAAQRGGRDVLLPEDGRGIVAPARRETADAD